MTCALPPATTSRDRPARAAIYFGGTPEQIEKYVPNLVAGKTIGMMALTESGGGSDAEGNMKTFAKRDGDVYRISGQKMWASMANETDVGVLLGKTDRTAGVKGVTAFIVHPKKYPGWNATPIDMPGPVECAADQHAVPGRLRCAGGRPPG
jgi:alkylation response protein AidB-like acyl-CoA dehydrogenase